jgi:hypothetical protein
MNILEEIQNAAIDASSDLGTILRKCKLLAARLGNQPLEDWLIWESNGYPDHVEVPDYRIWHLEVKGHFSGPFGSGIENAPIPLACLPMEVRKHYQRYECRQSIASIESTLKETTTGIIKVSTGDLALTLGMKIYKYQNCVQAWAEFGAGNLIELVNAVRNRILDFALAVWKEAPNAGEPEADTSSNIEATKLTQIFNTTVYGGSAKVVGTATASSILLNIVPGDFSSLEAILRKKGVHEHDITDLQAALEEEKEPKSDQGFGPKVSAWISKMMGKAAEGSWNISLSAAGNILSEIISKFYGL